MGLPIPEWFDPTIRDGDEKRSGDLRPSEVVHWSNSDPAEQAPLVCSSIGHTAIAVGERGDDTASAACTSILYRVCYDPPR